MIEHNGILYNRKSPFFNNNTAAFEYLLSNNIIDQIKQCIPCGSEMKLSIYKILEKEKVVYRCTSCRRRKTLYSFSILKNCKIEICELLFYVYGFVLEIRNNQLIYLSNVSKNEIINLKKSFIILVKNS
jgi:hypothetical protein